MSIFEKDSAEGGLIASSRELIALSHGAGGQEMHELLDNIFLRAFEMGNLQEQQDSYSIDPANLLSPGERLAFTTDTFVVKPIFFPGGDIGRLSIFGTVNDLAMSGASPVYISCGFVLAEGFSLANLERIIASMAEACRIAGCRVVAGDTKVVERSACDGIFINTSGIGVIPASVSLSISSAVPGDAILINGTIGDHGAAIIAAREELSLESDINSDCSALNHLVAATLAAAPATRCFRDATRGGAAGVLNEIAAASSVNIEIDETLLPISTSVRGLCEILGLDPLYLANEGKCIALVPEHQASDALFAMRSRSCGERAAIIGRVLPIDSGRPMVSARTGMGGRRLIDTPAGEQLPRIC
jgi:hydrogenase expression/formation protein HypE